MSRTRLSLWYVVAYLAVAGLSLLIFPNFALTLLLSNNAASYGDIFPRFVGMTLIGLDRDQFFLVVFAIVGVGVAFTGYNYLRERSA